MTYKPEGFVKQSFSKGSGSNSSKRPRDVLVEVIDYDLTNHVMICRDVDTNREIRAHINPETVVQQSKTATANADPTRVVGYMIDERMATKARAGSRATLENVIPLKPVVGPDKKTYSSYEAKWIKIAPDNRPDKAFRAIITGEAYQGRASSFQVWENRAMDVQANNEDILTYLARMDEVNAAYARQENTINLGLQLRAMIKTGVHQEAGKPDQNIYEVIDTTGAFSWVPAKRDAESNIIEKGHPIDQASAVELIRGYLDYLNEKFANDPSVEYRVEVMPFREFRASQQSKSMMVRENSPLSHLTHTQTRCSPGDTDTIEGKNWAVNGILFLSKDKAPEKQGDAWEVRNFVQEVFTNGYRGHVCTLVWAFDGGRVKVHPEIDRVARPNYAGAATPASEATSAAAVVSNDDGFGSAGDVFSEPDAGGDVFGAVLAQQSAQSTPPASAPAPAPAAAPAEAAAPPAAPAARPGANVFGGARKV